MTKSQLRSRLRKIISHLDEIISSVPEQAVGLPVLKKCRENIQRVLIQLNSRKVKINLPAVLPKVYRLIDCLHFFIFGKEK